MDVFVPWPRHHWVRLFITFGQCEPGHGWLYAGLVRRDAWRIGRIGFGILRMPKPMREDES